jgi:hypothetical protein
MIGECAGYQNTGTYNALLGYKAGSCLVGTESNNLIIGSNGAAFAGCSGVFLLASPAVEVTGVNSGAPFIYGNACGAIAFRTAAATNTLDGCYGTSGQFLQSRGATNSPAWAALPIATKSVSGIVHGCTTSTCGDTFLGFRTPFCQTGVTTGGGCNTFVGQCVASVTYCQASNNNVVMGYLALPGATTVARNVVIGSCAAGWDCAGVIPFTGCDNILIGHCVAPRIQGGASKNVIIGAGLNPFSNTGTGQLALGYNIGGPGADVYWLTGNVSGDIRPGRAILDSTGSAGFCGQLLTSTGNAIQWCSLPVACTGALGRFGTVWGQTPVGNSNIALGYCSQDFTCNSSCGIDNTAIGYYASADLASSGTVSNGNTSVGAFSLVEYNTLAGWAGNGNTALGAYSGYTLIPQTSVANCNTFVGYCSGASQGVGASCNTILGALSGGSTSRTGCNNTLLGYNAQTSTAGASNEIVLGNANNTVIRANVITITALSDGRDKKDVAPLPIGLEFIKALNPVTFKWNQRDPEVTANRGTSDMGFIAQELLEAENSHSSRYFSKLVFDKDPEKLEASYGRLIPVLVKAIQELSNEVDRLKEKLGQ